MRIPLWSVGAILAHNRCMARYVVFTADDFGISEEANRAIVTAHVDGVLTSASIMVCESAAAHAASLARDLPRLGVGLHLTLSDGQAAQSHADAPGLVGAHGRFRRSPFMAGLAYWFLRDLRTALRREIAAQFDRCETLGLHLDHADGHQHLHVHPVIWDALIEECARRGIRWVRLPVESHAGIPRSSETMSRRIEQSLFRALAGRCRRMASTFGVRPADHVVGHLHTGDMTEERLLGALDRLHGGVTEIYMHPAANDAELRALTSPRTREAVGANGIRTVAFGDLEHANGEVRSHGADS